MRTTTWLGAMAIASAIAGCSASHGPGGGPACGPVTCASDQVCCNESCGICAAPDEGCIAIACTLDAGLPPRDAAPWIDVSEAPCAAIDARGVGDCDAVLGWAWNGSDCATIGGCSCAGRDCGSVSSSRAECSRAHEACLPPCGGFGGAGCPSSFFCDYPDRFCGGDDGPGVCRARPDDCLEPGGVLVCGCDGVDHIGECAANLAGVDAAYVGSCADPSGGASAAAWSECGPADGPAWRIELSTAARDSCDLRPPGTLVIWVWDELEGSTDRAIAIDGSFRTGQAEWCPTASGPCERVTGTLLVEAFFRGEVARFDAEFLHADHTSISFTDVELARFWCRITGPGCG